MLSNKIPLGLLIVSFQVFAGDQLLNIDFGDVVPGLPQKVGKAAFGFTDHDQWNLVRQGRRDLIWSDGSPCGASLAISNPLGLWGSQSPDSMLETYLYSGGANIPIVLTNVPPGFYDLYFYAHGEPGLENGVVQVSASDQDYGIKTTSTLAGWSTPLWTEGKQYVLFNSIAVGDDGKLSILVKPGEAKKAVVNGMQLIRRELHKTRAKAVAEVLNGFVVAIHIVEPGYGYTEPPQIDIVGGGGTGASAVATLSNSRVSSISLTSAGIGYSSLPIVTIEPPPFLPTITVRVTRVAVDLTTVIGGKYQLEVSDDLQSWNNAGEPFIADREVLTQEFSTDSGGRFFRLNQLP
jgi:hypothetical protein